MLLSWKHDFLFVHVPKTGGTAVTRALAPFARPADRICHQALAAPGVARAASIFAAPEALMTRVAGVPAHATLEEITAAFGPARISPLFKFGFARNPYTLAYSFYHHVRRLPDHPRFAAIGGLTFYEALAPICEQRMVLQTPYLAMPPRFNAGVDMFGAFERLEHDFAAICARIGVPAPMLKHRNVNPAPPVDLAAAFGDRAAMFADAHRFEFARLGYSEDVLDADKPPTKRTL